MSGDEAPFTTEQQQKLKEMLSEAVREALQVEREKAPAGEGK